LVFFGGADPTGEILKFYQALIGLKLSCDFWLVATASHQHLDKIKLLKNTEQIHWLIQPENWHTLIKEADYYFGSTGTVTWERFYFGLPGSVVCIADNQIQIAEELEKAGVLKYYGLSENADYAALIPEIEIQAMDVLKNQKTSLVIQNLVDKLNAEKLREVFSNFEVGAALE
jgi:spore coat polysaccharide biosynthesis predicted glycosyltransferase SpsG